MRHDEIGELLAKARYKTGLTCGKLGKLAGVSETQIHNWESGDTIPCTASLEKLGSVLDIPLDEMKEASQAHAAEVRKHDGFHWRQIPQKSNIQQDKMISALSWAASRAGVSYGNFICALTPEKEEAIYREFQAELKERKRLVELKAVERAKGDKAELCGKDLLNAVENGKREAEKHKK